MLNQDIVKRIADAAMFARLVDRNDVPEEERFQQAAQTIIRRELTDDEVQQIKDFKNARNIFGALLS